MEKTKRISNKEKIQPQPTKKTIYLEKDNDQLVSFCSCEPAYITYPPQLDCPWCGCGWLFTFPSIFE